MRCIGLGLMVALAAGAVRAEEAVWQFLWQGGGGYTVRGGLSYDASLVTGAVVRGDDLTCFFIEGLKDGGPVGRWGLAMLNEKTWWRLNFAPVPGAFLVEGMGVDMPQAWNMDGFGTSCGAGGFGFNIGNAAQDICIDGTLIVESQIDPFRSFPAERAPGLRFPPYACVGPDLMSALE
ncbi:hypothetical protein [Sagittula salina]|uniref:Uncharacterized protein n=1 Tax=Sagittula salina TaxID=2820268 RepID=A0A940S2S4_9RHOB|nr:hypothetical protein [Sagittula salina]MBP0482284.1 hypothetical protein [Sagittula salina]